MGLAHTSRPTSCSRVVYLKAVELDLSPVRIDLYSGEGSSRGPLTDEVVIGIMDLRATALVAAAITVERLAPAGERVARAIGAVIVGGGLVLIARAAGVA